MMRRKLIRQGRGGLTFYVPKNWIDERNLQAGDEINIEQNEDKLTLSSDKKHKRNDIEITINNESKEFIRNYLNQLYRLGYDKIKINCDEKNNLLLCQKFIQMFLLGFEITKVGKDFCVAENISEPKDEKEETILRRVFLLIEESYDLLLSDIKEGKLNNKENVERNTRKVSQYDNFYRRNLVRKNIAFGKQFFLWEMYSYILLIDHNLFHFYDKTDKSELKTTKSNMDIDNLIKILNNFKGIYSSFYKKDLISIDKLQNEASRLFDKLVKDKANYHLCEAARLQYLLCSPIISFIQANHYK